MNLGIVLFFTMVFLILAAALLLFMSKGNRESRGFGFILLGPIPIILRGSIALVILAVVVALLLLLVML